MTWIIRPPVGPSVTSDDFTLDDLMKIEKATGTPWSILNPFKSAAVAREFVRIALRINGADPTAADGYRLREMKNMFDFEEDEPFPAGGQEGDDADPLASTDRPSSLSASGATTGPRGKRGTKQ